MKNLKIAMISLIATNLFAGAVQNSSHIRDNTNNIILDTRTRLVWNDTAPQTKTWINAIDYCENLTIGSFTNWRLPNVRELISISDDRASNPATSTTFQNIQSNKYFTSTTFVGEPTKAWIVDFSDSASNFELKADSLNVVCVVDDDNKENLPAVNLNNGLVAHYEFEDNANDSSENANHGTEYGGVTYTTGKIGKAGSFDGTDDYILVNNSSSFPENAITISFWINQSAVPSGLENYISKESAFQSYIKDNAYFESGFYKGSAGNWSGYEIDSTLNNNLNTWILYTITFDNNNMISKSYINGLLINSQTETDSNATIRISTEKMYIGKNGLSDVYYINGLIDDMRIYNRALNKNEIKALYDLGK